MGLFSSGQTPYEKLRAQELMNYSNLLHSLPIRTPVGDVLDVACGNGDIAEVVPVQIGGNYHGIDNNPDHIEDALNQFSLKPIEELAWNEPVPLPDNIHFACEDAIDLHKVYDFPQYFNMVISRHPQSDGGLRNTFKRIYESAVSRLAYEGCILVTTFTESEYQGARKMLEEFGIELVEDYCGENRFSKNQKADKYVIFGIKR